MDSGKKIKLLIITPTLECGGSEKYVALLCNHINTEKFQLTIVVLNNAAPFYTINHEVVDLKIKHVRNSLFPLKTLFKRYKPDIVFSVSNHLNLYLAIFKGLFSKKITWIARESSVVSSNSKNAAFPLLFQWLIKKYYRHINHIICQSEYMQQDLICNYGIKKEQTVVISNAVEIIRRPVLPSFNSNPLAIYKFVTVARLSKEKGIERLIHAVAQLDLPFSFHIIGDGDQREALQRLIIALQLQNKVFLEGKKQHPFDGMEDAALFLMGSYYEGFPNTLLEAGALGIPVVAFDVPGGIHEIITDGNNGLLVKNSDATSFAAAIAKALSITFNRQHIRDETIHTFSLQSMIEKTEEVFLKEYQKG